MVRVYGYVFAAKQWGVYDNKLNADSGTNKVTFPIAFPNTVFSCTQSNDIGSENPTAAVEGSGIIAKTRTYFTIKCEWEGYVEHEENWIAIGY